MCRLKRFADDWVYRENRRQLSEIEFVKVLHGMKSVSDSMSQPPQRKLQRNRSMERRTNSSLGFRASTPRLARRTSSLSESGCEISSWAGRKVA